MLILRGLSNWSSFKDEPSNHNNPLIYINQYNFTFCRCQCNECNFMHNVGRDLKEAFSRNLAHSRNSRPKWDLEYRWLSPATCCCSTISTFLLK